MMRIARIIVCVDYCLNQDFQDLRISRIRTTMKFSFSRLLIFLVTVTLLITSAYAQVVEIPDPNLEKAIREELNLPDEIPITQQEMLQLTELWAASRGITNLTGLEYATNLDYLNVGKNQISDILPVASLINLTGLAVWGNQISDLTPIANLTNLLKLSLSDNAIENLEPLAGLTQLQVLDLDANRVKDITPLSNLINLEILYLRNNLVNDFTPLQGLNLIEFYYDEPRNIPSLLPPVRERIENRSFPSVFQAWDHVEGQDHLSEDERYALHDLFFSPFFSLWWKPGGGIAQLPGYGLSTSLSGNPDRGYQSRQRLLDINPNMVFLRDVPIHAQHTADAFPPSSDFWIRDDQGQIVQNEFGGYLVNFFKPEVQDLLVKRIIAVEQSGLYDGVMLDSFNNNSIGFVGRHFLSLTDEDIIQAILNIFRAVRSEVHDDFLILINANRSKATRYAAYVNGTFMETGKDYEGGYTHEGLKEIESTLIWSEEHFRSPQINCLEGWGMSIEPPDGPNNRRWMRVFTTMSLTLSDGYVLYTINRNIPHEPHHEHLWYPFWDTDLGRPVADKAQPYQNIEGLFIREFTNGWAVYNRSHKPQEISLPRSVTGVSSGKRGITHLLPDLDGEIYLKTKNPADVNGDGVINVLDLVQVANGFGKSTPDPNGDGVVNILDLVFVARQFSQ